MLASTNWKVAFERTKEIMVRSFGHICSFKLKPIRNRWVLTKISVLVCFGCQLGSVSAGSGTGSDISTKTDNFFLVLVLTSLHFKF